MFECVNETFSHVNSCSLAGAENNATVGTVAKDAFIMNAYFHYFWKSLNV